VVMLFSLLRSDGISPSAVTLGVNSIISDFTGYHRSPVSSECRQLGGEILEFANPGYSGPLFTS
jgi:hypothetical protein